MKTYFVYIMASKSRTLYIGVTNNVERRVLQHCDKRFEGFTARYNINRLVYFRNSETFGQQSIGRSKSRPWGRMKKVHVNPSIVTGRI